VSTGAGRCLGNADEAFFDDDAAAARGDWERGLGVLDDEPELFS
jgi:hypothetical protein